MKKLLATTLFASMLIAVPGTAGATESIEAICSADSRTAAVLVDLGPAENAWAVTDATGVVLAYGETDSATQARYVFTIDVEPGTMFRVEASNTDWPGLSYYFAEFVCPPPEPVAEPWPATVRVEIPTMVDYVARLVRAI